MRRLHTAMCLIFLAVAACGDSSGPDGAVLPAELIGEWEANATAACAADGCALYVYDVADPSTELDLLDPALINQAILTLTSAGGFTLQVYGAQAIDPVAGTARVEGQTLIVTPSGSAGDVERISYTVSGDRLTLSFESEEEMDIDFDGTAETVRLRGTFLRR